MTDRSSDFIELVKEAHAHKQPLTIQGGGTKSFLGRQVTPSNHILDSTSHSGILNYEPIELIMRVRGGTPIIEIENTLAEKGQCLPSEVGDFDGKATIAGSLAANMSGPARPFAGSLRDHILGVSLINGEGDLLEFGGQVIKNVAGYDISRLQAGAMGAFGVMTDISFKVMPKWAYERSYSHPCDIDEALRICSEIASGKKPLTGAAWFNNKLFLRFSTNESALDKSIGNVEGSEIEHSESQKFWSSLRDYSHKFFETGQQEQIWRISVKSGAPHPAQLGGKWAFDWAGSQRYIKHSVANFNISELENWASRYSAEIVHWSGGEKSGEVHTQVDDNIRKIQLRLKKSFDPHAIFNPGRLYEWM